VGATRTLSWDGGIAEAPERCLRVSVGQSVTWAGDFEAHPLEISPFASGSSNDAGDGYTVTFTQPGAWGFVCTTHTEMNGGIWVTP
jgi:plastocyanin